LNGINSLIPHSLELCELQHFHFLYYLIALRSYISLYVVMIGICSLAIFAGFR
jgi:hypothetical protein